MTGSIKMAFDTAFSAAPVGGDVEKSLARQAGTIVEQRVAAVETGQNSGSMLFAIRAALYARTGALAVLPAKAEVRADPTAAYNGLYANSTGGTGAGAWTKIAELPDEIILAVDSGAGTANAIKVTVSRLPADGAVVSFAAFQANTAEDVTVEVVGGSTYAIRTAGGAKPSEGAITAGMVLLGRVDAGASTLRLATDTTSIAIQTASEAARDLAKDFANKGEDQVVADGLYSARHWATKAADADAGSGAAAARDAAVAAAALAALAGQTAEAKAAVAEEAADAAQTAAANAQASSRVFGSWTDLVIRTATVEGESAEVLDSDTGTHLDGTATGYDGTEVPNAGRYYGAIGWGGTRWLRIGSTGLSAKASTTEVNARIDQGGDEASGYLFEWLDKTRLKRLAGIRLDGVFEFLGQTLPEYVGGIFAKIASQDTRPGAMSGYLFEWVDTTGRRIMGLTTAGVLKVGGAEVPAAAQLNKTLRSDGLTTEPLMAPWRLRETRRLLQALKGSVASSQLPINLIGESWMDDRSHFSQALTQQLKAAFGDAGIGYVGAGKGSAGGDATLAATGSWVAEAANHTTPSVAAPFPSLSIYTSSTAGDQLSLTASSGADSIALHHLGGNGVVRYRYGSGSWTTLALDGSGAQVKSLSTPPAGALALTIEVVSGTCVIGGPDARKTQNGVRVNKCASGGCRALEFTSQNEASWIAAMQALGAPLNVVMLGINNRAERTLDQWTAELGELLRRLRIVSPFGDILVVSPPEIQQSFPTKPMSQWSYVARTLAEAYGAAHLDFQQYFGDAPADYGNAGRQYFTSTDDAHTATNGDQILREGFLRALLYS
ncbi:hypothetical protein [Pleomorphomonas sp. PLEO]|uniref:hypothetical protein n=1 Tax=Pleomorphomonas sp. PLEO TaxID=3239306 RepID=UPI00351E98FF